MFCGHKRFTRRWFAWDDPRWAHHGMHHGGGRAEAREGRDGSRRRRMFDSGDLKLVLLDLIAEKPRHGYELIKAIEDSVGGAYSPSPGVVYPTLTLLDETGLIRVEQADGTRKLYGITAEGRSHLEANRATLDALRGRMDQVGASHAAEPPAPVLRAFENLKLAVRFKLARGGISPAQAAAIAAILDSAAQEVEKT